jgi:hypothetical protein
MINQILDGDIRDALYAANTPSTSNPFVTEADIQDISCSITSSVAISVVNNLFGQLLVFNTVRFDTDTMFSLGSPTMITINTPGKYLIGGAVHWQSNVTGMRQLSIFKNGTTPLVNSAHPTTATLNPMQNVTTLVELIAGDFLELFVYQNSGAALDVNSLADHSPNFWAIKQPII